MPGPGGRGGGSAPGEVPGPGGMYLVLGGGVVSQHALRQTPPPVNRITDRCKNITFATSLRTVITAVTLRF